MAIPTSRAAAQRLAASIQAAKNRDKSIPDDGTHINTAGIYQELIDGQGSILGIRDLSAYAQHTDEEEFIEEKPIGKSKAWKEEYDDFVRENWDSMTAKQIAEALGVSQSCAGRHIKSLGLHSVARTHWSKCDIDKLRKHYGKVSDTELARIIGKSKLQIGCKAKRLGLKKG